VYLGLPPDNVLCRPTGLVPKSLYLVGLDEALSSTREDDRGALRDINGDSPFTQPPMEIVVV